MKRLSFVILFIISVIAYASQMKREAYIDIPTASFTEGFYINVNSSYPIKNVDDVKFDPDIGLDLTYKRLGLALKWYNDADFALDLSYQMLKESTSDPGLAIGISEISYNKYVSSAGFEDIYNDEEYPDRPPEIFSLYFVGTKALNDNFEMTAGIGRGRYVGYGPVSEYFNSDIFSEERRKNWAFGLFGGVKIIFSNNLAFIAEMDGRDANIGLEYQNKSVRGNLGLEKLEHIGDRLERSPRVSLGFSYRLMSLWGEVPEEEKNKKTVSITLIDNETREPVMGYAVIVKSEGDTVAFSTVKNTHSFTLEPGVYNTIISATGYLDRKFAMTVRGNGNGNGSGRLYAIELNKITESQKTVKDKDYVLITDNFEELKEEIEEIAIKYPFQRAYLNLAALTMLKRVVKIMNDNKDFRLLIIGHSCYEGSHEYSQRLSERRAENLKEYMIGRGVPSQRIGTEGRGDRDPVANSITEEGRIKNRRANFILYKVKK